jgi:hypothetical protein
VLTECGSTEDDAGRRNDDDGVESAEVGRVRFSDRNGSEAMRQVSGSVVQEV